MVLQRCFLPTHEKMPPEGGEGDALGRIAWKDGGCHEVVACVFECALPGGEVV